MLEVLQKDLEFERAGSARIDVLVATIQPRQASGIVKEVSALLPLEPMKLNHLKRIRSSPSQQPGSVKGRLLQLLLAPPDVYRAIDEAKRKAIEERYNLQPVVQAVPELEPRTRAQFEKGQLDWPMIFHHSTSEEARRAARVIPEADAIQAVSFMQNALTDAAIGRQQRGGETTVGAIIVDPNTNTIVASASRERKEDMDADSGSSTSTVRDHPLRHPTMLCVNWVGRALVAGKLVAGAGEDESDHAGKEEDAAEEKPPAAQIRKRRAEDGTAKETPGKTSREDAEVNWDSMMGVEQLGTEQYLCTGFDLYITQEPCLMCAMALVHSRIRRVIYGVRDPERGCLGSLMMLHTLASLNHNYRVFEGVCPDECRQSIQGVQDGTDMDQQPVIVSKTS